jgi:zinc protease
VGNITRAQAEEIATQLTRGLPESKDALPTIDAVVLPKGTESRIAHPSSQSHVLIGMPALQRGDADFFPIVVGNYILGGGGFASRLLVEVREKRGLAYSAYSYFSAMAQLGPFQLGLQTKKEQTDLALKVARDTLETFLREGPTEKELKAAKQNLVGGFPLRIDSNKKLLDQLSTIGFYRLPNDYLDHWSESIERVSIAQIREAFQRKVKQENLVTVIVGQGEAVK